MGIHCLHTQIRKWITGYDQIQTTFTKNSTHLNLNSGNFDTGTLEKRKKGNLPDVWKQRSSEIWAGLPECQEMYGEIGPLRRMETMFFTRSAFSGCFSNTSRKPGSWPVSKIPVPASWLSIPSCQKTCNSSREKVDEGGSMVKFVKRRK